MYRDFGFCVQRSHNHELPNGEATWRGMEASCHQGLMCLSLESESMVPSETAACCHFMKKPKTTVIQESYSQIPDPQKCMG